ncbi:hypothetical protein BJN45_07895 [Azonexus hydrophilus]|uniref:AAA+ ATPase domain-containing protein n=1 Tax=Azonexus hydrophilus TaxID=418702 RepID=A0A1R1I8W3_9RHOO|nr:AAA family ATPase [Azonexus hydrophilus]OMG55060.1 hypothetical protein BJN45_07895 [Azonexus hydrophilus]
MDVYLKQRKASFPAVADQTQPYIVLQWDNWNDYDYYTTFVAYICSDTSKGEIFTLGEVKIMSKGQKKNESTFSPNLVGPIRIPSLAPYVCSLGCEMDYYNRLAEFPEQELALDFLRSMNDAATDSAIRTEFQDDDCFKVSLLRSHSARVALDEAGKLFGITTNLVSDFVVEASLPKAQSPHKFHFDFRPKDGLPHRVHAMVGQNGVGKTQIMARIAMLMSRFSKKSQKEGTSTLETEGTLSPVPSIYNVVAISFSAFDEFERPTVRQGDEFRYSYCGLRSQRGRLLSEDDLLENIRRIIKEELDETKKNILADVLGQIIKVEDLRSFIFDPEKHRTLYDRLSAGQRIALNAILHSMAKIEPRTLILFDEPELHLHPQLLTTMLASLFDILEHYDSFAIIATHSPIVIQQLPSSCVHIVLRDRFLPSVIGLKNELFGENLSDITRQVFLSTESDRDFRNSLDKLLERHNFDVEKVESLFDGRLGLSAQIYLASRKEALARRNT